MNGYSYEVDRDEDYVTVQVVIPYAGKRIQVSDIQELLSDELASGIWEIIHDNCGKFNRFIIRSTTPRCVAIIAEATFRGGHLVRRIHCKGKSSSIRMSLSVTE